MAQNMQPFLSASPSSSTGATSSSDGSNGHGLPSTAKPSGAPLASGSSPDTSVPMDWESSPSINISLATDVEMEDATAPVLDISVATDVEMEEATAPLLDISVSTDVEMEEVTNTVGSSSLRKDIRPSQSAARVPAIRGPVVTSASSKETKCSQRVRTIRGNSSSVPVPSGSAGTSGTSPPGKINQLRRPRNVSVPNNNIVTPKNPPQDAGTGLSAPQGSVPKQRGMEEKRARKKKLNPLPRDDSKLKPPTGQAGAQKKDKAAIVF